MTSGSAVVVWCYCSRNLWIPFLPLPSNRIERELRSSQYSNSTQSNNVVDIGHVFPDYATPCEVDFLQQVLRMPLTGKVRRIDRLICHAGSLFANNAVWEYYGDTKSEPWMCYDIDTAQQIEDAHIKRGTWPIIKKGCNRLDLSATKKLPYIINLKKKCQKNILTKKVRPIRRTDLSPAYMDETAGSSGAGVTWKRKSGVDNVNGATSMAHRIHKEIPTYLGDLPKKRRIDLGRFEGPNSDNVDEFLVKFLKSVTRDSGEVAEASNVDDQDDDSDTEDEQDVGNDYDAKNNDSDIKEVVRINSVGSEDIEGEECAICFDNLNGPSGYGEDQPDSSEVIELFKCHHRFHRCCVIQMYKSCGKDGYLECPCCKCVYGQKVGTCPAGSMEWDRIDSSLSGYEGYGTLEVTYRITRGIQSKGHPNPGKPFNVRGFPRVAFIPDTEKGRVVLRLLMEAFRRRLMFTIGTSTTTGEPDTVTWNDIHHKTEATSNYRGHGYPDPNYLDNALMELTSQGVTQDCLKKIKK